MLQARGWASAVQNEAGEPTQLVGITEGAGSRPWCVSFPPPPPPLAPLRSAHFTAPWSPFPFMHVAVGFANTVFISKLPSNCWALWKATVMWADCTQGTARGQAAAASLPSPSGRISVPFGGLGSVPA